MNPRFATTVAVYIGSLAGHHIGDYLEQPDWAARAKQERTSHGRKALLRHVAGYAACQAAAITTVSALSGARVPARSIAASVAVQALVHGLVDDGSLLATYAQVTGKGAFHDHAGAGCPGGSGRALMDQAMHAGPQILLGLAAAAAATGRDN